jgi:hypothetical protein
MTEDDAVQARARTLLLAHTPLPNVLVDLVVQYHVS